MAQFKSSIGTTAPLGASYDGKGVNFALFSAHAEKVELCLFDPSGSEEIERYAITENDNAIWHIYLEGVKPDQVYGYRVYGPYKPEQGLRFNHHKLLIDPYGKKLIGKLIWNKAIFGYDIDSPDKDLSFSTLDSAPYVPKSVVCDGSSFDWGNEKRPNYKFEETVIYETQLRGYTMLHPYVPEAKRGTFAGFNSRSVINYLKWLGITAVEFLPGHAFFGNRHKKGYITDNYWGYESFSFFAPEQSYLAYNNLDEIRELIKNLHNHGIEVIMDVVYNHTGEGNQLGPTLCYRGIDNSSYYTLNPDNPRYYYDSTGCGASFNIQNPFVLRLVMDSLRYWAGEMHIDGFRFDLAPTLSRLNTTFTRESGFLYAVSQDPVLRQTKMIAEAWDVGFGGYQVGAFLPGWAEWNDKYRDNVRRFWKGDHFQTAEMASRLTGSSDVFNYNNRDIWTSVNFITAHDGFNLNDLVSYNNKHNTSNGENNRDGNDSNWSWNSGTEGETDNAVVRENRIARAKAMFATLLLCFGTPMMLAGDEFGHTQMGNNNPYCQDNALTWLTWEGITDFHMDFARDIKQIIKLRKKLKIFERRKFFTGKPFDRSGFKDITWYTEQGREFTAADWHDGERKCLSYCVYTGSKFVMCIFNANFNEVNWKLPVLPEQYNWNLLLNTSSRSSKNITPESGATIIVPGWSVLVIEIKK